MSGNGHNPHGEANFTPANYDFQYYFDPAPEWLQFLPVEAQQSYRDEVSQMRDRLRERSSSIYGPTGRCAHCGAWIRYHVVFRDTRDGSEIAVGETCAEKRFGVSPAEWSDYKRKLDRMRERARRGEKRVKLREEFPEALEILEDFLSESAEFDRIIKERAKEDDEREAYGEPRRGNRDLWKDWSRKWPNFVKEIAWNSLLKWGKITERQAAAVVRAHREYRERMEAQERENETADPVPVTDKRITVEGTVLTTRGEDTAYGWTLKMLVRADAGWKVWGTAPDRIQSVPSTIGTRGLEKGDRVRFDARVTPSPDDPKFGFFKRPTKAEVIQNEK